MKTFEFSKMHKGWFVGDFEPTALKTDQFEIAYHTHKRGEQVTRHTHRVATEYNLLISGSMTICGQQVVGGTIFVLEPGEISDAIFHEDCHIVCIKTPSVKGDKYLV